MSRLTDWLSSLQRFGCCFLLGAVIGTPAMAQDLDFPRVAMAQDKRCQIEVRGKDSSFVVFVTGLVPHETVEIISESEGEIIQYPVSADENGVYSFIEIPLVSGKSSGIARISVMASRCRLEVSFPWRE